MNFFRKRLFVDLQLFADGGAGDGAGANGAAGVGAGDAGQQNTGVGPAQDQGQAGAAGQQNEDPEAAFEKLIKGQYKDQYGKRVEDTMRKRMAGVNRQLQEGENIRKQYDAAQPILEILAQKYGLEATDLEGIAKAAQEDASFFQEGAMSRGMDVKDLMDLRKIQRSNASMQRQLEQYRQNEQTRIARQQASEQAQKWQREADALKQVHPSFDLDTELNNESFKRMLQSGVPMQAAYTALHADEIMHGAMQYAAKQTEQRLTDSIIAGAGRPSENGTGAQGAVSPKVDPKKLSDAEIKAINERVRKGEKITFT